MCFRAYLPEIGTHKPNKKIRPVVGAVEVPNPPKAGFAAAAPPPKSPPPAWDVVVLPKPPKEGADEAG